MSSLLCDEKKMSGEIDLERLNEEVSQMRQPRERLHCAIQTMLSPSEFSQFPPIIRTIERHLKQYQLRDRVSPHEIFSEACDRALKKCEKGEEIPNIPAWFRTTCFYIVSEKSREFRRTDHKTFQPILGSEINLGEQIESALCHPNHATRLDILARLELYYRLPKLEQKILYLHASGLSWDDVADRLIQSGEYQGDRKRVSQSIAQRASRARKYLCKQYFD
jgi:hypothetical protein